MRKHFSIRNFLTFSTFFCISFATAFLTYHGMRALQTRDIFFAPPITPSPFPTNVPTPTPATKQPPTSIFIPKLNNRRWPIQAAIVKGNTWDLFDKAVAWLATSSVPNEGNVILYAHDWKSLWADLYKLKPGDPIEVDQNGIIHTYIVTESRAVNEHDVDAILSEENMLTLFTCEGVFDQKRRVVYAKPE